MLDTLAEQRRQVPCYAGYDDVVIFANGRISLCEQVVPFGSLVDWDWDLAMAWNSVEAWSHRALLTSCSCIHGCNIATSIARGITPIEGSFRAPGAISSD